MQTGPLQRYNISVLPLTINIVSPLLESPWTELLTSHLKTKWPILSIFFIKVPTFSILPMLALFSYKKKVCTGGLASALHVKLTVILAHTLFVTFVVQLTFRGRSDKKKNKNKNKKNKTKKKKNKNKESLFSCSHNDEEINIT